jgi:membrane protein
VEHRKWPVLCRVVAFMIALLYYASPTAKRRGLKSIFPGAALAIVVWLLASAAFVLRRQLRVLQQDLRRAGRNHHLPRLVWITNVAILLGAELNAERERSRQLAPGEPEAEREIQLEERSQPKATKRSRTARPRQPRVD